MRTAAGQETRRRSRRLPSIACLLAGAALALGSADPVASAAAVLDLATVDPTGPDLLRVHGYTGDGRFGVPVASGLDVDGDTFVDYAMAAMLADPSGRADAGEVVLVFGDGTLGDPVDAAVSQSRVLRIIGDGVRENTGSELWLDDVTGDGLGDLLIARQNFSPTGRVGAGALTILVGGQAVADHAATLAALDLRAPPMALTIVTFVGAAALDRLGIWMRTGDVTGDGVADIVVGADQADDMGEHVGEIYVIRGGSHLAASQSIDLAQLGTTALAGHIARVDGPRGAAHSHLGATCQIADLDGNGRAEVLAAAALNRAGAALPAVGQGPGSAHGSGGATDGTLYILWDDNFPDVWPAGYYFAVDSAPGTTTAINGAACNVAFGEEILGGLDYDADGDADLFVGDITGDCAADSRPQAGSGHVFYDAKELAGLSIDLDSMPALPMATFLGAGSGDIAADTALHGDFDGDQIADLAFSAPHRSSLGRVDNGSLYVFFGRVGAWPAVVDLGAIPQTTRATEVLGANGAGGGGAGDVLAYSGAAGDLDGDGRVDLVVNEMLGDGVPPSPLDVGNLIALSGTVVNVPEPGVVGAFSALLVVAGLARRRQPPKRSPPSASQRVSSSVDSRPSVALRCGKRPKRSITSR